MAGQLTHSSDTAPNEQEGASQPSRQKKILVIDAVELGKRLGVGVRGSHRSDRVDGPIGVRLANRPDHRRRHNSVPETG